MFRHLCKCHPMMSPLLWRIYFGFLMINLNIHCWLLSGQSVLTTCIGILQWLYREIYIYLLELMTFCKLLSWMPNRLGWLPFGVCSTTFRVKLKNFSSCKLHHNGPRSGRDTLGHRSPTHDRIEDDLKNEVQNIWPSSFASFHIQTPWSFDWVWLLESRIMLVGVHDINWKLGTFDLSEWYRRWHSGNRWLTKVRCAT